MMREALLLRVDKPASVERTASVILAPVKGHDLTMMLINTHLLIVSYVSSVFLVENKRSPSPSPIPIPIPLGIRGGFGVILVSWLLSMVAVC